MSSFLAGIAHSFPVALKTSCPHDYPFVCYYASQILAVFLSQHVEIGIEAIQCVIGTVGDDPEDILHCWVECFFEDEFYVVDATYSQYNEHDIILIAARRLTDHHAKYTVAVEKGFSYQERWETFIHEIFNAYPMADYRARIQHWKFIAI